MGSYHIEALRTLLRETSSAANPDLKFALNRVHSELAGRLVEFASDSEAAFLESLSALGKMKGTANGNLRLLCLHKCWTFFYYHDKPIPAFDSANQHELLAEKINDSYGVRRGKTLKALVHSDLGDIGAALLLFSTALDIAITINDVQSKLSVIGNLGTALNYAGLYREAIPCFQRVIEMASATHETIFEAASYSNLAQSYMYLAEFEDAEREIIKCLSIAEEPRDGITRLQRCIREFTYVQVALELGDFPVAIEHARSCRTYGYASNVQRGEFMADIAMALCDVRRGEIERGLNSLQRTCSRCKDCSPAYTDVLVAMVKAYDEGGVPEKA